MNRAVLLGAALLASSAAARPHHESGEPKALVEKGEHVFRSRGCNACHRLDGARSLGPSLLHLYGSEVPLATGVSVRADDTYLRESLIKPNAKVVKGYVPQMPDMHLSEDEIQALLALMHSLK